MAQITHAICVKCLFEKAVLAFERFGYRTYLCPQCQHVWTADTGTIERRQTLTR
jgi:hypothetical protein